MYERSIQRVIQSLRHLAGTFITDGKDIIRVIEAYELLWAEYEALRGEMSDREEDESFVE